MLSGRAVYILGSLHLEDITMKAMIMMFATAVLTVTLAWAGEP
jgi:hypothetical protein